MNNTIAYKLAQLPKNALIVGIDPHKRRHAVVVRNQQAQVLSKFKIGNRRDDFEQLLVRCQKLKGRQGADRVIFAIEPGSHYWRNLAYFLEDQQQVLRMVNPFTLKRQRDGDDLMRRKNDYRDAAAAADLVAQGKYNWTRLPKDQYAELRVAHDTYQQLVEEETRARLQLTTALDGLFPEFQQAFKSLDGQTALAVLQTCPNPHQIVSMEEGDFIAQVAKTHNKPRLMVKKLVHLYQLAKRSVGIRHGSVALARQVGLLAERLVFLKKQRQKAEEDLQLCLESLEEKDFLLSIRGLGVINVAGLLAHIGDCCQYSSVKQLSKLAGIVPIENSSAGHSSSHTPMSKKGRRGLRAVTYRSVIALLRHNEWFARYTESLQKRPGGKNPLTRREAIGAAMNKLLRIIYALLTKRQTFDPLKAFAL